MAQYLLSVWRDEIELTANPAERRFLEDRRAVAAAAIPRVG